MRVLFVNLPYSGHIYPTLGLVQELIERGHQVAYVLTPEWEQKIAGHGAEFIGYDNHPKLSVQMRRAYHAALSAVPHYDLILYEQFFFLGKPLAEKFNKPVVRIFTSLAANDKLMYIYVRSGGLFGLFRWKWVCKSWTKEVAQGIPLKTDSWLEEITHNPPELNLVYTVRDYQMYADEFSDTQYKFLGPSIYERPNEGADLPLDSLKKPIIYISLGTIFNKSKAFYKKCFSAFGNEAATVIMPVGDKTDPSRMGAIPDNFIVKTFVPQIEVLKKADVFITHGGVNSINEALYFGVPMVVIPAHTDQPANAGRVEELKLGRRLSRRHLTHVNVKKTTMLVMSDPEIRHNISEMQKKMHEAGGNRYGADVILAYAFGYRSDQAYKEME